MSPNSCPTLLLNADYRPISVYPLSLLGWQDAVRSVMAGRVDVVDYHNRVVRSPSQEVRLPSVVALREYQRQDRPCAFTRIGIFLRDRGRCAYCDRKLTMRELTFDHIEPQSRGGGTSWLNICSCCSLCNAQKADRSLEQSGLRLLRKPHVPSRAQLNDIALREFPPMASRMHPSWLVYLGLEAECDLSAPARVTEGPTSEAAFPADLTSEAYWNAELEG